MQRFWSKTQQGDGCWLWEGGVLSDGYGAFWLEGSNKRAHRVAYLLAIGEIPDGMCVCHTCDVRLCVNPSHLWVGTRGDNLRDMGKKGRANGGTRKLKPEYIPFIRGLRHRGMMYKDIAELCEVHPVTIGDICRGKAWRSI